MVLAVMMMPMALLQAEAGRLAGRPVAVDARLVLADCAEMRMRLLDGGVEARCVAPAWRVILPFEDGPQKVAAAARPRGPVRGARVETVVAGAGFEVRARLVADGPAGAGETWLKAKGGRRVRGRLDEDGRARPAGLKGDVNGR
jgi:hypothetical protein